MKKKKSDQEEVVSKEVCPYCGKIFTELDAHGCRVSTATPFLLTTTYNKGGKA